jgi:hypothetical protein
MDSFQFMAFVIGLASVTTWVALRNSKAFNSHEGYSNIRDMPFEVLMVAVSWIAAILIAVWVLR